MMNTMTTFFDSIIMVGPLGKESLAATGVGAVLFYLTWLIGYGPVAAVSPIVAQILGAHPNDRARTRAAVRMGLWAIGFMSIPLMVLLIWAKPVLLMLGQDPKIVALAEPWVHAVAFGLPFSLGFGVLRDGRRRIADMKDVWPELLARPHIAEALGPDVVFEGRHLAWPIPARIDRALSCSSVSAS